MSKVKWQATKHELQGIGSHTSVDATWIHKLACGCDKHHLRVVMQPESTLREVVEEMTYVIDRWEGRCPYDGRDHR